MSSRTDPAGPDGPRVLLVDDDADKRLLVRRLLVRRGITSVDEASNGQHAIEQAHRTQPDLIILDLAMPVLNGLEALPGLRLASPQAEVVVLSKFPRRRLARAASDRGAVGYVEKSVPTNALVDEILIVAGLTGAVDELLRSQWFPADIAATSTARRFTRQVLTDHGLDQLSDIVMLLVSELSTNAVSHGKSPFRVDVRVTTEQVRIEVFDEDAAMPKLRPRDPLTVGGNGLLLIDELADRWGADPFGHGKVIWFELNRPIAASA